MARGEERTMGRIPCAIIGSGNIGTDLMYKLLRSTVLDLTAMVGIEQESEGLARARREGVDATHEGIEWLLARAEDFRIAFEATSARVHAEHAPLLEEVGLTAVDLTPAAVGPAVVPSVNLTEHLDAPNVNLITCGGQATIPMVAAVSRVCEVPYAEIVSTVASSSAGPGTRRNIDEFTRTTARGLEEVGGASVGKAIIVLNPAEPPIIMRNTVYCALPEGVDTDAVDRSVEAMLAEVQQYVPGYRMTSEPIYDDGPYATPGGPAASRVTLLLEVTGAADYLPPYAGNLDIMTAAARQVGETLVLGDRTTVEVEA